MKLEDPLRRAIQRAGHAYNSEKPYVQNYNRFLHFIKSKYGQFRHPSELNKHDIEEFLTHLAADKNLAPDTQRVALSALKFLYQQVLEQDFMGLVLVIPREQIIYGPTGQCGSTASLKT